VVLEGNLPQKNVFKVISHTMGINIASKVTLIQHFSGTVKSKKIFSKIKI
jgi:hypothetical protein